MATSKQRGEWEAAILADRPDINPWILKNLLDVYCAEGGAATMQELVKQDIKNARKGKTPVVPTRPSVIDGITVGQWNDTWEARTREVAKKAGARLLSDEEAAAMREKNPAVSVEEV